MQLGKESGLWQSSPASLTNVTPHIRQVELRVHNEAGEGRFRKNQKDWGIMRGGDKELDLSHDKVKFLEIAAGGGYSQFFQ